MISSLTVCRNPRAVMRIACLVLLGTGTVLADTLWTRSYSGPYGGDEAARVVLPDTFANVVVVGSSNGESGTGGNDFVVIKYSWFHGNTLWTRRITGRDTSDDVAQAAAIDSLGVVTVTGQSGKYPNYDMLTVQLNPNGSELWRATYDGTAHGGDVGTAIAVDTAGSVFVAGYTQNATSDYVTIKYNWDGSRAWTKTYDGGDDKPTDIALGPDGSVYVTGNSGTVKYSSAGVQQWVQSGGISHATALVVDESGSVYVTGSVPAPGMTTYPATVKYDSAGTQKWADVYQHPQGQGAALARGASALYVAGMAEGAAGDVDYITIAYDYGTGDTLWVRRDSGPAGSYDAAVGIAVGSDSAIWVAGSSNYDFVTVLYTPDGVKHWVETYGSPGDDQMAAMALDKDNHVIVTGITWAGASYDLITVAFDTIGPGVAEPPSRKPLSGLRFSLAPNPSVSGYASLRLGTANAGAAKVTVFGADGRAVLTQTIKASGTDGTHQLNLSRQRAGVYMVRLESGGRSATQKLVVEH